MSKGTGGAAFPSTGGTAFPFTPREDNHYLSTGMTLRDYFAAKAMQGDWSAQDDRQGYFDNDVSDDVLIGRARVYYRMADAMLKARGE